jgi:hypothetical protein
MAPDGALVGVAGADHMSGTMRIEVVLNWLEELKARVPTK